MPDEPLETVDVRNNRESAHAAAEHASPVARASDGGAVPREAPASGELPETVTGGTAEGDPIAGVGMSEDDVAAAVKPDEGPE